MGSSAATSAGRRRAASRATGARRRARTGRPPRPGGAKSAGRASRSWLRRLAVVAVLLAALPAGYFLWLRDSSLVAVKDVTVEGVETGERDQIVSALTRAARTMTTLHVDAERLEAVAARFPTIESVSADPSFPTSLTIEVVERPPAAVADLGGRELAIAADGTVLRGVDIDGDLPRIDVGRVPSERLRGEALDRAAVAAAAPGPLKPLIRRVERSSEVGVRVLLRGGVALHFGTGANAEEKWAAAAAALADPRLESASYVDVRVPRRPAVGG